VCDIALCATPHLSRPVSPPWARCSAGTGVPCETPQYLAHGSVTGGGGYFPGIDAHYTCDDGYYSISHTGTSSCDTNGESL
jgi:hypothetical protein